MTYRGSLCCLVVIYLFLIVPEQNNFVPCLGRGHMTHDPIERGTENGTATLEAVEHKWRKFNRGKRAVESTLHWGKGENDQSG